MDGSSLEPGQRAVPAGAPQVTGSDGTLDLPAETASVPRARRFVREVLTAAHHEPETIDAAELCVSELVTNAVLHARTEVQVGVEDLGAAIRLEVRDRSTVMPRRLVHSVRSATGRGMEMVSILARSWGVDLVDDQTKSVWCELSTTPVAVEPVDVDDLLAAWPDDDADVLVGFDVATSDPALAGWDQTSRPAAHRSRHPNAFPGGVLLLGYPVRLGIRSRDHSSAILRECALLSHSAGSSSAPGRLIELAQQITSTYSGELAVVDQQRNDALARGEATVDLRYPAIRGTREIIERWQQVMEELDDFAAGTALLTQATPPELVDLRNWTISEFIGQLEGREPSPWRGPVD
jgi:Histidine kinase-like ATPase domain